MKYPKLDKTHAYLGHFRGCMKEGHNTNEMPGGTPLKDAVKGGTAPAPKPEKKQDEKQPTAGIVRG